MQAIYLPGGGALHALHPLTKLCGAALLIGATYLLPWWWAPLAVVAAVAAVAAATVGVGAIFRPTLIFMLPLLISLLLIQGLLFPPARTTPIALGPIVIWADGLRFAGLTAARLLALATSTLLALRTTHPADLVFVLTERGLPRGVGYVLLVALQLVPDMGARATAVLEAQQARGLETGNPLRRLAGLPALVGPLLVGALMDVESRAMAIEGRGFYAPGRQTNLRRIPNTPGQRAARALILVAGAALIGWRLLRALGLAQ
jgi:energy-coupling factor transport system permease protein